MSDDKFVSSVVAGTILGIGAMVTYVVTRPIEPASDYQVCTRSCRNSFPSPYEGDKLLKCLENCTSLKILDMEAKKVALATSASSASPVVNEVKK